MTLSYHLWLIAKYLYTVPKAPLPIILMQTYFEMGNSFLLRSVYVFLLPPPDMLN